jgi:GT2 family glycosyltransferase
MGRNVVSIVVITWNSSPFLSRCLDAVRQQTAEHELIVVDNASTDDSLRLAVTANKVIRNESNRGFAAAANQGIQASSGDFILLLNPDCFLEPEYCARLIEALKVPDRVGSATGKLLLADDPTRVDSKGIRMTRTGRHLDIEQGQLDTTGAAADVFGVSGAAAMYRRDFLDEVAIDGEYFDEDFFAYREDADLSWRGQLFGWRAVYVSSAVAHHVRRVTPEKRRSLPPFINMHSVKNRFLLRWKNQGAYLALRNAPFELFRDLVTIAAVLTVERSSLPAFKWLWQNRRRVQAKRRAIQRRRRVSDRQLARWFR